MGQKARILVIDDEPQFERLMLQRFRRKLRAGVYEFLFAQNGLEALDVIQQDTGIEMVLTDLNMPKMDGLSFLARLRDIRPGLKTVVVSAYGDMKNIRAAMNLGAFDFVTKPIEFQDLETTIEKTLNETATLKKAEHAKELEAQNTHLEELDKMKTQFFTNISHEFRTPLTVISGMAEQIEEIPSAGLTKAWP
jgi:DNA-binding NtrC family response regulator